MIKFHIQILICLALTCLFDFSSAQHVVTVAENNGGFASLVTLLDSAVSAKQQLVTDRNMTFFGPSDVALRGSEVDDESSQLEEVLKAHVVPGMYTAADLLSAENGCMVLDTSSTLIPKIKITIMDHGDQKMILVNNVHVIVPDVMADNGIFHGVDGIILPNSFTPCHGDGPTVPTDITSAAAAAGQSSLFARIAVASTAMLLLL